MRAPYLLSLLFLAGCATASKSDCDSSLPGDLTVAIASSGPATDAAPVVRVFDAAGERVAELSDGETMEGLAGGAYTWELARGWTAAGTAVGALDLGAGAVCVGGDPVTVEVSAAEQPASGRVWASSWESVLVLANDPAADALTPEAAPLIPFTNNLNALSADATGNLWGATPWTYGARLVALPAGAMMGAVETPPAVEVSAPSLAGNANFTSLSFDGEGNAWATASTQMGGFVGVVGWSAATLRDARIAGGVVEAEPDWAVVVDGLTTLSGGYADAVGDLWITSTEDQALVRVARADLVSGTTGVADAPTVAPAVRMRLVDADGNPYRGVESVVEGASGGLFVLAATTGAIVRVPASALEGEGDVTADALQLGVTALPTALAADGAGGVWWSDTGRVGHVSAAGEDGNLVTVEALERAGAVHADVR
jgi:hypothetical protein